MTKQQPLLSSFLTALALGTVLAAPAPAQAHKELGRMWTFEHAPLGWFQQAYDWQPTEEWLEHARMASLRLGRGRDGSYQYFCSASFVSPHGLIMTNHHCSRDFIAQLQGENDWQRDGGLQLVEVAGGYQIVTRPELSEWVRRLFHERSAQRLSVQALETLAVIAYRQPVTAPEIAEIRGVNTTGVLNTLLERRLIKVTGRKAVIGRPFLYATTREFLDRFGLRDLKDLPKVEDMAEALGMEVPAGLVEPPPIEEVLPFEGDDGHRGASEEQVH